MDLTPKGKGRSLSCRPGKSDDMRPSSPLMFGRESTTATTPVQESKRPPVDDYSPIFMLTAQVTNEVDVIWDFNSFNSPQNKQSQRNVRRKSRVLLPQSPKPKFKKHSSNNQLQSFDTIKEEMEAIRQQVLSNQAMDDDSFEQENEAVNETVKAKQKNMAENNFSDLNCDDFMDDSLDQMFLQCTEAAEKTSSQENNVTVIENNNSNTNNYNATCSSDNKFLKKPSSATNNSRFEGSCINNWTRCDLFNASNKNCTNDSIDNALAAFDNDDDMFADDFTLTSPTLNKEAQNLQKTVSEVKSPENFTNINQNTSAYTGNSNTVYNSANIPRNLSTSSIIRPNKTGSYIQNLVNNTANTSIVQNTSIGSQLVEKYLGKTEDTPLSKEVLDEIERKKLEAKAKLEARRKGLSRGNSLTDVTRSVNNNEIDKRPKISPTKVECVNIQEEIERKRLEAIARREAKLKEQAAKNSAFTSNKNDISLYQNQNATVNNHNNVLQASMLNNSVVASVNSSNLINAEVERKRLEAMAKLEKRKQNASVNVQVTKIPTQSVKCETPPNDIIPVNEVSKENVAQIIERNRQEALKRLEQNKRKRALEMNSTLPRRTHYAI